MNRNKRTAIVLGVAVLMAAIASLGVYRIVKAMPARAAEITTGDAVVAAHPLTLGTRLTADHVKVVQWPAGSGEETVGVDKRGHGTGECDRGADARGAIPVQGASRGAHADSFILSSIVVIAGRAGL